MDKNALLFWDDSVETVKGVARYSERRGAYFLQGLPVVTVVGKRVTQAYTLRRQTGAAVIRIPLD